jgi:hypothetical protein
MKARKMIQSTELDFTSQILAEKEHSLAEKQNKNLNKPFRLPKGEKKKFGVYVKNDKGNVVMVKFSDPNMEIKRDNKERRKAFRSRHNCSNPGPKWKARYWSCKMWSDTPVSEIAGSEEDLESLANLFPNVEIIDEECFCEDCCSFEEEEN